MSKEQNLSLELIHEKGASTFSAVMMTAYEARFINEQANLGFIELKEKPTTIAIQKFKEDKLKIIDDEKPGEEETTPE